MCLAVPMQVIEVCQQNEALVESMGVRQRVRTELVEEVAAGDFVLVHAGCAIEIVDTDIARESLQLWQELLAAGDQEK